MASRRLLLALPFAALALGLAPLLRAQGESGSAAPVVRHFTLQSKLLGRSLSEALVTPRGGGKGRPLLVLLHGYGATPDFWLSGAFFDAYASLGKRAPNVLLANGGEQALYHDRPDARWGSSILEEAIPAAIRRTGADRRRIAVGGISMGGLGALAFAIHAPGRYCAAGGHSAALWHSYSETPIGGPFFDEADWARNNVLAIAKTRPKPFGSTAVWIDVGREDPFVSGNRELAQTLAKSGQRSSFHLWPGAHDVGYWSAHMRAYLGFYAGALARCRR